MKKLQIMIEVEIDENEIENVETTEGNHVTTEEFINGLEIKESNDRDSGAVKLLNENEEYYLMNIGDGTRCMKNPKIIKIEEV